MRLTGRVTQDGRPVDLDVVLVPDRGGRGTVTADGVRFSVIRIGELVWLRAPRAFYATQPSLPVDLLADRWLEGSAATGQLAELASFTRPELVAERLLSSTEELTESPVTVEGASAVALSASTGTLVVSQDAPVRPLRAEGAAGSGDVLTFSDYGAPVELRRPTDVVTASQLQEAAQGR